MRKALGAVCLALAFAAVPSTSLRAQDAATQQQAAGSGDVRPSEPSVPLAQPAVAFDAEGRETLAGLLRTQALAGTPDAPVRNTRIVIQNRSPLFYNYVAGWATFYGEDGVRCGEGLWKLEALAPREQVEVDTPGLRLTCTPTTWRVVATTLLTRTTDVAKPGQSATPQGETDSTNATSTTAAPPSADTTTTTTTTAPLPPLEINVNGKTIPIQLGNPLEFVVGKERVRIVVRQAP